MLCSGIFPCWGKAGLEQVIKLIMIRKGLIKSLQTNIVGNPAGDYKTLWSVEWGGIQLLLVHQSVVGIEA